MPEGFELSEPMPCYDFNASIAPDGDDGRCVHCRKYLTVECEYIEEFLDEGEDE